MEGINIITDEKGNNKALLLDLIHFKKLNIKSEDIIKELANLQEIIDQTPLNNQKTNSWDAAKEKLNQIKDVK